jgi:hypothetical protein
MKKTLNAVFTVLIFAVLIGKVLNWFLHFSDDTNRILNTAMFTLIGISYIVMGYVWDKMLFKVIMIACGVFLIARNFLGSNLVFDIMGIVCILVPMLIARFATKKEDETNMVES